MVEITNLFDLNNRVVIITGGSGYLGKSMCDILSQLGACLIIGSRSEDKNKLLSEELGKKYNSRVVSKYLDLSNKESVNVFVSDVINEFGRIDVLINNSYYGAGRELHTMDYKDWQRGIDGSINSTYRMIREVIVHMIDRGYGHIINIASMYGIIAPDTSIYDNNDFYNPPNYGVGKAGIIQLTKYIASVYGSKGINCNCISPGPFPSDKVRENKDFVAELEKKVPLGRVGSPEDLKGVVALLASDASSYINGANISVDGGWTIW